MEVEIISLSRKTVLTPEEVVEKSTTHLTAMRYTIIPSRPSEASNTTPVPWGSSPKVRAKGPGEYNPLIIRAEGSREYNLGILIVLLFIAVIIGIIYYFVCKKNKITVDATKEGKFTITYDGSKAFTDATMLANLLQQE